MFGKSAVHDHPTRILTAPELVPPSSLTAEVQTDLEEPLSDVTTGLICVRLIGLRLVPFLRFLYRISVILPYKLTGGTVLNLLVDLKKRKSTDRQVAKPTIYLTV